MKVLGRFTVNGEDQFRFQVGHRLVTAYKGKTLVFSCTCGHTWSPGRGKSCKEIVSVVEYLKSIGYKQFE